MLVTVAVKKTAETKYRMQKHALLIPEMPS